MFWLGLIIGILLWQFAAVVFDITLYNHPDARSIASGGLIGIIWVIIVQNILNPILRNIKRKRRLKNENKE